MNSERHGQWGHLSKSLNQDIQLSEEGKEQMKSSFSSKFQTGHWLAELEKLHFLSRPQFFFFHLQNENNNSYFYEDADRIKCNDRCKCLLKVKHSIIMVMLIGKGLESPHHCFQKSNWRPWARGLYTSLFQEKSAAATVPLPRVLEA